MRVLSISGLKTPAFYTEWSRTSVAEVRLQTETPDMRNNMVIYRNIVAFHYTDIVQGHTSMMTR